MEQSKCFEEEYEKFLQQYNVVDENLKITITIPLILKKLKESGFNVVNYNISTEDYKDYLQKTNYVENYPKYLQEFGESLPKKTMQHYISYKLLDMCKSDVYMDIASSNSVFPQIVNKLCGAMTYRQDIRYKWGKHGECIGSFASEIPMPDESINYMALHCSLEHFEDNEDYNFFKEAYRLLTVGGKVCIVPLYLANEYVIMTSPSVWYNKYAVYTDFPKLDIRAKISINESIKQRQSKHYSVEILKEELLDKYSDKFDIVVYHIENASKFKGAYPFALILTKLGGC